MELKKNDTVLDFRHKTNGDDCTFLKARCVIMDNKLPSQSDTTEQKKTT